MSKLNPDQINVILATDCGSTTTKAILIEKIDGQYRQTFRGEAPTTVEQPAGCTAWTRAYWQALHPHSSGGAYVNFLMDEGEDPVRAAYGQNFDRLVELKNKYDPTNLFRRNQNIPPTT